MITLLSLKIYPLRTKTPFFKIKSQSIIQSRTALPRISIQVKFQNILVDIMGTGIQAIMQIANAMLKAHETQSNKQSGPRLFQNLNLVIQSRR